MNDNYKNCIHAEKAGSIAVYVYPTCPRLTMIKGHMVSSKKRCSECRSYKSRCAESEGK